MTSRLHSERGITLIEALVSMTLMMLIFGATLTVYTSLTRSHQRVERHNEAQEKVRLAVDRMTRELRNLAAPSDFTSVLGTYPASVEKNDRYDFVFKSVDDLMTPPASNPVGIARIRYCLDASDPSAGKLYRQVQSAASFTIASPATASCPAAGFSSTVLVSDSVVNTVGGLDRPLFTYSTEGALLPYNHPDAITDTTRVGVRVWDDPTPQSAPKAAELSSSVLLRNQNRRPMASFTVTVAGRTVELNAGQSDDPEGERLTYEWWEDGVKKDAWSEVVVRTTYSAAGNHTYMLVVRDPARLDSASDTQTVNLP